MRLTHLQVAGDFNCLREFSLAGRDHTRWFEISFDQRARARKWSRLFFFHVSMQLNKRAATLFSRVFSLYYFAAQLLSWSRPARRRPKENTHTIRVRTFQQVVVAGSLANRRAKINEASHAFSIVCRACVFVWGAPHNWRACPSANLIIQFPRCERQASKKQKFLLDSADLLCTPVLFFLKKPCWWWWWWPHLRARAFTCVNTYSLLISAFRCVLLLKCVCARWKFAAFEVWSFFHVSAHSLRYAVN